MNRCAGSLGRSHLGDLPHEDLLVPRPVHLARSRPQLLGRDACCARGPRRR
jgi:hypothetical protein